MDSGCIRLTHLCPEARQIAFSHDTAPGHEHDPVADGFHLGQDVGGQHDGPIGRQIVDERSNLDHLQRIQSRRRLVEHQHSGLMQDRRRQSDPLPESLGQLPDDPITCIAQSAAFDGGVDRLRRLVDPVEPGTEYEVFVHTQFRIQRRTFRQIAHDTGRRLGVGPEIEATDRKSCLRTAAVRRRAFAWSWSCRPVVPQKPDDGTGLKVQIDLRHGLEATESLAQATRDDAPVTDRSPNLPFGLPALVHHWSEHVLPWVRSPSDIHTADRRLFSSGDGLSSRVVQQSDA